MRISRSRVLAIGLAIGALGGTSGFTALGQVSAGADEAGDRPAADAPNRSCSAISAPVEAGSRPTATDPAMRCFDSLGAALSSGYGVDLRSVGVDEMNRSELSAVIDALNRRAAANATMPRAAGP